MKMNSKTDFKKSKAKENIKLTTNNLDQIKYLNKKIEICLWKQV